MQEVKGKSFARTIVHKCTVCKRAPLRGPPPPTLPEFRVKDDPAFTYTEVDFAGPLFIQESSSSSSKVWICLFSCLVTRAIDIVEDLSTSTFMRCSKRFAARRGTSQVPIR